MKKLQIKIPLLLPEVPDEKDQCVKKLIIYLQDTEGLEKVHVADEIDNGVPQLCFHYDPELISIDRIQSVSEQFLLVTSSHGRVMYWEYEGTLQELKSRFEAKGLIIP